MYIQLEGQILYYEKRGEGGKNLILLHGNGEDHSIFDELVTALCGVGFGPSQAAAEAGGAEASENTTETSGEYTIYAIDTRGHGLSATPSEYHYEDMADDLISFIEALHIEAPTVFGFSDGGVTALIAASKRPALFSRIIAAGANSNPRGLTFSARAEIKRQFRSDHSPLTGMMLTEPELTPAMLTRITCPVLLLAGQHDMVKEKDTKRIAAAIPNAEVRILPGEDHGSYVIHSAKCAEFIA